MEVRLKTTVGGQLDFGAVRKAIDEAGPLEPETEYVLRLDLAPASVVAVAGTAPAPATTSRSERARRAAADEG